MHRTNVYRTIREYKKITEVTGASVVQQLCDLTGQLATCTTVRNSLYELENMGLVTLEAVPVRQGMLVTSVAMTASLPGTKQLLALPLAFRVTTIHLLLLLDDDPTLHNETLSDTDIEERIRRLFPGIDISPKEGVDALVKAMRHRRLLPRSS